MDLAKLFNMQRDLMEHIEKEHPPEPGEDRFNKRVLALLVEVGECANEWRGFKFWSKDQKPRTRLIDKDPHGQCAPIETNPLLEEYVDGLHCVIDLGIVLSDEFYWDLEVLIKDITQEKLVQKEENITDTFTLIFYHAAMMRHDDYYGQLFGAYLNLGEMLGFTWEQIEQAYMAKNAINHHRLESGY
ncbi:dUTP diphosphatase [Bacillus sp. T33-2]|uniref:dUTP diphosphatase n=1 Tax=Bacillus sp. T33-2 TaxID=2054168 RepID=UPI000C77EE25|nr:dUTP diphosphatase [Bacillus sp. T33-2]PLR93211.1 dUTPase [Bacillus sp. T33-2]